MSAFVWGTLIDKDKDIIIAAMQGIFKYTSDGKPLWNRTNLKSTPMPTLMGNALYGIKMATALMYALDIQTGETIWQNKVAGATGEEGDMVKA